MTIILACLLCGFLAGFVYVLHQRKIRFGKTYTAVVAGLLLAAFGKLIHDQLKRRHR